MPIVNAHLCCVGNFHAKMWKQTPDDTGRVHPELSHLGSFRDNLDSVGHYNKFLPWWNPDKPKQADLRHAIRFSRQEIETEIPADSMMRRSRYRTSANTRESNDALAAILFPVHIRTLPFCGPSVNPWLKWFKMFLGMNYGIEVLRALAGTFGKNREDCNASRALRLHGGKEPFTTGWEPSRWMEFHDPLRGCLNVIK